MGVLTLQLQVINKCDEHRDIDDLILQAWWYAINFVVNHANAVRQKDYPENVQQYYP